jgi:probable HAF family extracellular repeat protein
MQRVPNSENRPQQQSVKSCVRFQFHHNGVVKTAPAALALALLTQFTAAGPIGPAPYLQASDSPLASLAFNYFHLENFEDALFNVPGVSKTVSSIIGNGLAVDSVDADDGTIDGLGNDGHSLRTVGFTPASVTFTFDAVALGSLPTHAGIVWTDGGTATSFEAFGPGMVPLGMIGPFNFSDGDPNGGAAEDRFFGWSDQIGILAIKISPSGASMEVDHLQYGLATVVPEPASTLLVGIALPAIAAFSRRRALRLAISVAIWLAVRYGQANAAQPLFMGLGDLPGGTFSSYATAVSADGSVVVGLGSSTPGGQAFRWTQTGGMIGLGDLPGGNFHSVANGVSDDGTVVVGSSNNFLECGGVGPCRYRPGAFRWTQAGGMTLLGTYGTIAGASDASADGSVVVGGTRYNGGFRWTQEMGMEFLPGVDAALGVSTDGLVVVGVGGGEVIRWTLGAGIVSLGELGDLPGDTVFSQPEGVSPDGSVVIGESDSDAVVGYEAFRWTPNGGMVGLGILPGSTSSWAYDVSAGGSIIVGTSGGASGTEAFLWDAAHGMRSLRDVLVNDFGLGDSLAGWTLEYARGISADGQFIVGSGVNPSGDSEAWLVRLETTPMLPGDYNQNGTVDAADYTVWRDGGSPDDTIGGYNVWKARFGQTAGNGALTDADAAVAEPAGFLLFLVGLVAMFRFIRRMLGRSVSSPSIRSCCAL